MNWRFKALAFRIFEVMPGGGVAHRLAQRFVTGRYIPKVTAASLPTYSIPVEAFQSIPDAKVALEFGAGRGLISPLLLSRVAERTYALDLQRLAHIDQVNAVIGQLASLTEGDWSPVESFSELEERYGVIYRAPADARCTGLPDASVDLIYSTAVLEHVPADQIRAILTECKRILQPNGRICCTIDYHDHYASSDPNIGFMNFYQFSPEEWRRYNPGIHYQNRLRHSDFAKLFTEEGWEIVAQRPIFQAWSETDLARVKTHEDFVHYTHEDLTAASGYFLLAKGA